MDVLGDWRAGTRDHAPGRSRATAITQLALRIALAAFVLAEASPSRAQDAAATESSEYLIKAGYVYNFAKLVEWPAAVAGTGRPIVIGVVGNDAFAGVLDTVVGSKKIDGRPFLVKRIRNTALTECGYQILFVTSAAVATPDEIAHCQRTGSVLTIGESPDFVRHGGIVALVVEDSRVRFLVNIDAASQASLTISSRLLALATVVHSPR